MADDTRPSVVLRRTLRAPARDVARAWLEPELVRRWLRPLHLAPTRVVIEPVLGGRYELEYEQPGGAPFALRGRIAALSPDRLALELCRFDGERAAPSPTRIEVRWREAPDGCRLELEHLDLAPDERDAIEAGWQACLTALPEACVGALERFYSRLDAFPRYRSRFGGTWPDLSDAEARLEGRRGLGWLDERDAVLFRHWIEHGYVILPGAVDAAVLDRIDSELEHAWTHGDERLCVEVFEQGERREPRLHPRYRDVPHKVLELHSVSASTRDAQFAPAIRRFLARLFERPPLAFQSLTFRFGSEQALHQDTAYVALRSPMELVGCWIALEDVRPGSGELVYHAGSHRIPEYVWFGRGRARPYEVEDDRDFQRHVREESERAGCRLQAFRPRRGDALLWHADLVHGGAPRTDRRLTRKSLVTHFCPLDVDPLWYGTIPSSPKLEHAPGCWYCHPLR